MPATREFPSTSKSVLIEINVLSMATGRCMAVLPYLGELFVQWKCKPSTENVSHFARLCGVLDGFPN